MGAGRVAAGEAGGASDGGAAAGAVPSPAGGASLMPVALQAGERGPEVSNLQTDAMGRMARLCFGNFLDEVVSDFATVTGTEGRNNPSMLELAQRHHEARDEAQGQMDGQQVRPNAFRQHNLAGR